MNSSNHYDILVIGSGPAGQKAAVQGAKAGKRVAVVERDRAVGGSCVHTGTIPSKTLRENALQLDRYQRTSTILECKLEENLRVAHLIERIHQVVDSHVGFMRNHLERNQIERHLGRARFVSDEAVEVMSPSGSTQCISADVFVIATGSRPRIPPEIPVDHQHILGSDSILSMNYLPDSLTVLGGGIIACEYASIFLLLGVRVTVIDRSERPLAFLDPEMTEEFLKGFRGSGGRYLSKRRISEVGWDGVSKVTVELTDGEKIESEKMLVAIGRQANLESLSVENAGLEVNSRGGLEVDRCCRTPVSHIYAVGDVAGPPGLASSAMEQGQRAVLHSLGLGKNSKNEAIPMGIYTIPEMSAVGITEQQAADRFGGALVARARFDEVARGQISGLTVGFLKLVADPQGKRLLGVHIVGEGATELIHLGQMGLLNCCDVDFFADNIFNFPTLAEAYRVASLDVVNKRSARAQISRAS